MLVEAGNIDAGEQRVHRLLDGRAVGPGYRGGVHTGMQLAKEAVEMDPPLAAGKLVVEAVHQSALAAAYGAMQVDAVRRAAAAWMLSRAKPAAAASASIPANSSAPAGPGVTASPSV
jgi:hypothetical protein